MTFQAAGAAFSGAAPAVDPTPEQRIKQLKTQLREQKKVVLDKARLRCSMTDGYDCCQNALTLSASLAAYRYP